MIWQILLMVVVGALVGWIAGKIMKSDGSLLRNIILGLVGGALGAWVGSYIPIGGGWVMSIILGIVCSCLLIFLWRLIFKKR